MEVWYCPKFDEIHLVIRVNKWLGATVIEYPWADELVAITFPREHLGWTKLGDL